jgi:hypothetical protein
MPPKIIITASLLLATCTVKGDVLIDDFNAYQFLSLSGGPSGYKSGFGALSAGGILGGEREVHLERLSGNSGSVSADVNGSFTDAVSFASSPATAGRSLFTYDGGDGLFGVNPIGLGGIDLTEGGLNNGFMVNATSDLGATLRLSVFTDADHYSTRSFLISADPSFTFTNYFNSWATFTAGGSLGGADFTNVGAITVELDGSMVPGTDVGIDFFASVVPEPSSMITLLTAGLVLGCRRRRPLATLAETQP